MISLVRKTLEIYLGENRVITQSDFPADVGRYISTKDAVFVTLYADGRVIASSGRIQCKKENTLFECIDNTLLCLKDERFAQAGKDINSLASVHIRVDVFSAKNRRILSSIQDIDITKEWIIFLSQNLWTLSVVLPHMVHVGSTPEAYFSLACKKAWVDESKLTSSDYVIYGLTTETFNDMEV